MSINSFFSLKNDEFSLKNHYMQFDDGFETIYLFLSEKFICFINFAFAFDSTDSIALRRMIECDHIQ